MVKTNRRVLYGVLKDLEEHYHILSVFQRGSKAHGYSDETSDDDYGVIVLPKVKSLVSGYVKTIESFHPHSDIVVSTLQHVVKQLGNSPQWVDNLLILDEFIIKDDYKFINYLRGGT